MSVHLKRVGSFEGSTEFPQEKKQKIDNDSSLFPNEVVLKFLSYCDPLTLENTLVTSKKWSQLTIEYVRSSGIETMKKAILESIKTIKSFDLLNESNPPQFKRLETIIIELPKEITETDTINTTLNKMKTISSSVVRILCEIPLSFSETSPSSIDAYTAAFKGKKRISLSEEKEGHIPVIISYIFNSSLFFNSINHKTAQSYASQMIVKESEDMLNRLDAFRNRQTAHIAFPEEIEDTDDSEEIEDTEDSEDSEDIEIEDEEIEIEEDEEVNDPAKIQNLLGQMSSTPQSKRQFLNRIDKIFALMQKNLQPKQ